MNRFVLMFLGLSLTVVNLSSQSLGNLYWQKHSGNKTGDFEWQAAKKVGNGWTPFSKIVSGQEGIIYAVNNSGKLLWYNNLGFQDGTNSWSNNNGVLIDEGWDDYKKVMCSGNGVFYAVDFTGNLFWLKHLGHMDGTAKWDVNSGNKVGQGWDGLKDYFCGTDGVIYAVFQDGSLKWTKHLGVNTGASGASAYVNGGNWTATGINMNFYSRFFTSGDAVYAVENSTNDLYWWMPTKLDSLTGQPLAWANNGIGQKVGSNWNNYSYIFGMKDGVIYSVGDALTNVIQLPVDDNKMSIFPTVASDNISVQFEKSIVGKIEIVSVSGELLIQKEIFNSQSAAFEIKDLPKGKYFSIYRSKTGILSAPFIKL